MNLVIIKPGFVCGFLMWHFKFPRVTAIFFLNLTPSQPEADNFGSPCRPSCQWLDSTMALTARVTRVPLSILHLPRVFLN